MLLEAGIETNVTNEQGFSPRNLAAFSDCDELIELFPVEEQYVVPTEYYMNNHYTDMAPTIFGQNK